MGDWGQWLRAGLAGAFMLAGGVQSASAADPVKLTLLSQSFEDGELENRILADVEITYGKDDLDEVRLTSLRILGDGQELIGRFDPRIRFEMRTGTNAVLPDIDNIPGLSYQDASVRQAVSDLLLVFSANSKPFDRPGAEPKTKKRRRSASSAYRRRKEKERAEAEAASEKTFGDVMVHDHGIGLSSPVALHCARVTDLRTGRTAAQETYHTAYTVPEDQCPSIMGYGRDGVDNVYRVVRSGSHWRHLSGTRHQEVNSTVDRKSGHLMSASATIREDLAVRDFCTRHGGMCGDPVPVTIERQIELIPAP